MPTVAVVRGLYRYPIKSMAAEPMPIAARQKYLEMYQSTVAIQSKWPAIWADAENFAITSISRATQYRQAVFDGWMQGYFDVTEERCFDCHRSIGIPGGGYCLDCARRRRLI